MLATVSVGRSTGRFTTRKRSELHRSDASSGWSYLLLALGGVPIGLVPVIWFFFFRG